MKAESKYVIQGYYFQLLKLFFSVPDVKREIKKIREDFCIPPGLQLSSSRGDQIRTEKAVINKCNTEEEFHKRINALFRLAVQFKHPDLEKSIKRYVLYNVIKPPRDNFAIVTDMVKKTIMIKFYTTPSRDDIREAYNYLNTSIIPYVPGYSTKKRREKDIILTDLHKIEKFMDLHEECRELSKVEIWRRIVDIEQLPQETEVQYALRIEKEIRRLQKVYERYLGYLQEEIGFILKERH